MRIKDGFAVREVAGQTVVVAVGARTREFNAMITLNSTGRFLWEHMQTETDEQTLIDLLLDEYEVDLPTARDAVAAFAARLQEEGLLA